MQIKTIIFGNPDIFDNLVNEYLADGWELVQRSTIQASAEFCIYHYAQLVKHDNAPEPEFDPLAALDGLRKVCKTTTAADCGTDKCPVYQWCGRNCSLNSLPGNWAIPELDE